MPISFRCAECESPIRVRDELAGKSIKCPKCGAKSVVPIADDDEPEELPRPKRSTAPAIRKSGQGKKAAAGGSAGWGKVISGVLCGLLLVGGAVARITNRAMRNQGHNGNPAVQTAPMSMPAPTSTPVANAEKNALALLPNQIGKVALPQFPDLTQGRPVGTRGVTVQTLAFTPPPNAPLLPGGRMKVRVYLPPGESQPQTLPCVLVAPAGTPLIVGNSLDGEDYHDETLPYAEAGIVAVMYELDGGVQGEQSDDKMRAGYLAFSAAAAGVVNARNALEFVLAKVPQVNPSFVFAAGHSSAGNVALLFAEHEPRLAGCMAFAPCVNVRSRLQKLLTNPASRQLLPGIDQFVAWSSPSTEMTQSKCPVQIIQARDDSNVPISETEEFVKKYRGMTRHVVLFDVLPTGDHYQGLLAQAIPKAIKFVQVTVSVLKKGSPPVQANPQP